MAMENAKGKAEEVAKKEELTEGGWRKKLSVTISNHQMASADVAKLQLSLASAKVITAKLKATAARLAQAAQAWVTVSMLVASEELDAPKLRTTVYQEGLIAAVAKVVSTVEPGMVKIGTIMPGPAKDCLHTFKSKACVSIDMTMKLKNKPTADAALSETLSNFGDNTGEAGLPRALKGVYEKKGKFVKAKMALRATSITQPTPLA